MNPKDQVSPNYRQNALNFAVDHYRGTGAKPEKVVEAARKFHEYIYGKDDDAGKPAG